MYLKMERVGWARTLSHQDTIKILQLNQPIKGYPAHQATSNSQAQYTWAKDRHRQNVQWDSEQGTAGRQRKREKALSRKSSQQVKSACTCLLSALLRHNTVPETPAGPSHCTLEVYFRMETGCLLLK